MSTRPSRAGSLGARLGDAPSTAVPLKRYLSFQGKEGSMKNSDIFVLTKKITWADMTSEENAWLK